VDDGMAQEANQSRNPVPQLIRSATVKDIFDGISDMTLWRWVQMRDFPKPIKISGRNYWDPDQIEQWYQERAAQALARSE
jgi:predicted DNA-binding transcriptional regulator AlpA